MLSRLARLSDHILDAAQHRTLFYGAYAKRVRGSHAAGESRRGRRGRLAGARRRAGRGRARRGLGRPGRVELTKKLLEPRSRPPERSRLRPLGGRVAGNEVWPGRDAEQVSGPSPRRLASDASHSPNAPHGRRRAAAADRTPYGSDDADPAHQQPDPGDRFHHDVEEAGQRLRAGRRDHVSARRSSPPSSADTPPSHQLETLPAVSARRGDRTRAPKRRAEASALRKASAPPGS
jgi:hypothetical protein